MRTLLELQAKAISKDTFLRANTVRAICTHGVLSGNALEKIEKSNLLEVVITDTIPLHNKIEKIKIISVDKLFAETIRALVDNRSISSNFIC